MTRFVTIQTNFSTGEIDPLLRARIDLDAYNNALETAKNVLIQPQGGARRRPGLHYITALPNSGAESAANGVRLVPFEFSVDDSYIFCFTHNRIYIFKNEALVTNINGSGNNYLDTTAVGLTAARLSDMCWTQSADTMIITQDGVNPVKIVRGATDASWTISALTFDSIPKYAFVLSSTNPAGTITPSAVTGTITLTASSAVFNSGHVGQYINAQPQGRAKVTQYVSATSVKVVTEFPFFDTTAIASGNWEIESGYENVWSASRGWPKAATFHEGRLYFGGSTARPSTIWGSKVGLFFDFEAATALDDDAVEATLDTNTYNEIVDIVSARDLQVFTTGGEFYIPQEGLNPITPAAFFVKTVTNNGCAPGVRVQQIDSGTLFVQRQGKSLNEFAFTDTQLTYMTSKISLLAGHLLKSPVEIALRRAVATDENDLLLIVNGADGSMAAFSLLRAQNVIAPSRIVSSYDKAPAATLTPSAVSGSVTLTASASVFSAGHVGEYIDVTPSGRALITGYTSGTVVTATVINTLPGTAAISSGGWTMTITGKFKAVGVDVTAIYTVVQRTVNGGVVYYVEYLDDDSYMDSCVQGGAAASASMPHVVGETVNILLDGAVMTNQTVPTGGTVTFTRSSTSSYEVGLPFVVEIKTMPADMKIQTGTRIGFKKRIVEINAIVHNTQCMEVNGIPVVFRSLNAPILNAPVPEYTGIKKIQGIRGYSTNGQITIRQSGPLKLTLLGMEYKLSTHQGT